MDETTSTPPSGGTKTAVITNSIGQKSQTLSYTDSSGDADDHQLRYQYGYSGSGQLATVGDNNSNAWSYTYNLLGQQISSTDPGTTGTAGPNGNEGTYTYTYDGAGNLLTSTDPAGHGTQLHLRRDRAQAGRVRGYREHRHEARVLDLRQDPDQRRQHRRARRADGLDQLRRQRRRLHRDDHRVQHRLRDDRHSGVDPVRPGPAGDRHNQEPVHDNDRLHAEDRPGRVHELLSRRRPSPGDRLQHL